MAGGNGGLHAGRFLRLDADDADFRAQELDEAGNSRGQAAAADRHIDGADGAGMLAQQFEPDRALTGNDIGIIERVDEDITMPFGKARRMGAGGVEAVAEQDDLAAKATHGIDLDGGRRGRHDHHGADTQPRSGEGDTLGVIAGRGADDAAGALLGGEVGDAVMGAANLEGKDRLHVLALDQHIAPEAGGEQFHGLERGLLGNLIDGRGQDLADIIGHGALHKQLR